MTEISFQKRQNLESCFVQTRLSGKKMSHDENGNKSPIKWLPKNAQINRTLCLWKVLQLFAKNVSVNHKTRNLVIAIKTSGWRFWKNQRITFQRSKRSKDQRSFFEKINGDQKIKVQIRCSSEEIKNKVHRSSTKIKTVQSADQRSSLFKGSLPVN